MKNASFIMETPSESHDTSEMYHAFWSTCGTSFKGGPERFCSAVYLVSFYQCIRNLLSFLYFALHLALKIMNERFKKKHGTAEVLLKLLG